MQPATIIVCITTRCNLSCKYCYMDASLDGIHMSQDVLRATIQLIRTHSPARVQITGGEPLMAKSQLIKLIEAVTDAPCAAGHRPVVSIQTNGTLINADWARFFKAHDVEVGISMDGPPEVNDVVRGRGEDVIRAMGILAAEGVGFGVTAVLTRATVGHLDRFAMLLASRPNCVGMGLDFVVRSGRATHRAMDLFPGKDDLIRGLRALVDAVDFLTATGRRFRLRELERLWDHVHGAGGAYCHAAQGTSIAISPKGRLYPCGQTMGKEGFLVGDLSTGLERTSSVPFRTLRQGMRQLGCEKCRMVDMCPGDCPSRSFFNHMQGANSTLRPACILNQLLFERFGHPDPARRS